MNKEVTWPRGIWKGGQIYYSSEKYKLKQRNITLYKSE